MAVFVIDASSLIHMNRNYPPDIFAPIWSRLTELAGNGDVRSHRQVRKELDQGDPDDPVRVWAKTNRTCFSEQDEAQQVVLKAILAKYPGIVKALKQKEHADPWCVAYARVLTDAGEDCCLVNEEAPKGDGSHRIPNVCKEFGVKFTRLVGFYRRVGIKWE